jgi:hypothetical protein
VIKEIARHVRSNEVAENVEQRNNERLQRGAHTRGSVTLDCCDDIQIRSEPGVPSGGPHGRVGLRAPHGSPEQSAVSVLAERASEIVRYPREMALHLGIGLGQFRVLRRPAFE